MATTLSNNFRDLAPIQAGYSRHEVASVTPLTALVTLPPNAEWLEITFEGACRTRSDGTEATATSILRAANSVWLFNRSEADSLSVFPVASGAIIQLQTYRERTKSYAHTA